MVRGRWHSLRCGLAGRAAGGVVFLLVFVVSAQAQYQSPDMAMPDNMVSGVIMWSDGRSPVDDLPVRVWEGVRGRCVYRTRTDRNGRFEIPELGEGQHFVTAGPYRIDLRVLRAREGFVSQTHSVVLIVERRLPLAIDTSPGAVTALASPALGALRGPGEGVVVRLPGGDPGPPPEEPPPLPPVPPEEPPLPPPIPPPKPPIIVSP